ncbi:MAG TPA: VCBS repeat-containing protein [Thermoanaerobaculia bacterium]|nr:VCBS repeat-containing protein [Thermoanaerobaculia bacterium]
MKVTAVCLFTLLLATAAFAQLTPGVVVAKGDPFPIIADFNGDGLDDLVNETNVMLSDGTSFSAPRDFGLRAMERVIGVLDVNGDRIPDLLTQIDPTVAPPSAGGATSGSRTYFLYLGNTSGKYANPTRIDAGPPPYIADVDGDGKDDLLVMTYIRDAKNRAIAEDVTVLRSNGDGTFTALEPFRIPADPQTSDQRLLTADFNHDGHSDIVLRMPEDLVILMGSGGGKFRVVDHFVPQNMQYGWWSTNVGDIDGDGNDDIVTVGWRAMRVLFGDGHGAFPRMTTASIAKLHDASSPSWFPVDVDKLNQPRDLAVGHFTSSSRMQIAAGMSEGDIVVFEYQDGALKEVARTPTEFWATAIRTGHFHNPATSDVYAMGTLIWGGNMPAPRVFNGSDSEQPAGQSIPRIGSRGRALRMMSPAMSALNVQIGGDCIDATSSRFVFAREGIFGSAQSGDTTIEAVFDGANIDYRLTAPYLQMPISSSLSKNADGTFSGTALVTTSCGVTTMSVSATPQ